MSPSEIREATKIENINQINVATAVNQCTIDQLMEASTNMEASIDNAAFQDVLNTAKGLMSKAESDQKICNNINSNMSACKYLANDQCCVQMIQQDQKNLIDSGCSSVTNVNQSNEASALQTCTLSASSSVSDNLLS